MSSDMIRAHQRDYMSININTTGFCHQDQKVAQLPKIITGYWPRLRFFERRFFFGEIIIRRDIKPNSED